MAPMRLEIVTAESLVYSEDIDVLVAPGIDGELGILPRHAPLLTGLKPGELRVVKDGEEIYMAVSGGFMEVIGNKVTILADTAERVEDTGSELRVHFGGGQIVEADLMLVATGRGPTVENVGLEQIGIEHGQQRLADEPHPQLLRKHHLSIAMLAAETLHELRTAGLAVARVLLQNAAYLGRDLAKPDAAGLP